jgi:hypothetical protein
MERPWHSDLDCKRVYLWRFMQNEHRIILEKIGAYLEQNPDQRFGQAVFNLGINEFKKDEEFQLRDIYNDHDAEIIKRIEKSLDWFNSQSRE